MLGSVVCVLVLACEAMLGRAEDLLPICPDENEETPAPTASPYWADPEGSPPNAMRSVHPRDLLAPPKPCSAFRSCRFHSPYRTLTGHCNNPSHHILGAADQPFSRLLPPVYDFAMMRTRGADGCLLPNPRTVSLQIRRAPVRYQRRLSTLYMQVGQFIDHDLIQTSTVDAAVKSRQCGVCDAWGNPICAPIPIPERDPFLPATYLHQGYRRCLPFVRSLGRWLPDQTNTIMLRHINLNTAFLDLSTVYGSDPCREEELRDQNGGLLRESLPGLPPLADASRFVECRMEMGRCFLTGDDRANEHLGILLLHVTYFREHNRIARALGSINPHWSNDTIYQESRRINIAQYQKMVYYEFLPQLIGRQEAMRMGFINQTQGYYEGYHNTTDPSILEEFSAAAFRVGHAMIPNHLLLVDPSYSPLSAMPLVPTFHNPANIMQEGMYDQLLRGMIRARLEGIDLKLTDAILNHLFQLPDDPFSGQDLMAINIARGRDHALPPYVAYLSLCEGLNVTSFRGLEGRMKPAVLENLQLIYKDVRDVDLIVGALGEVSGRWKTMVGPTLRCIIGRQFINLKRADRFWFENRSAGFTPQQLASIRKSWMGRMVCDSMDGPLASVPLRALKIKTSSNRNKPCRELPAVNLAFWREDPTNALPRT